MTTEEQIREASARFYEALNRLLYGDPGPMSEAWHRDASVTSVHPMGDWLFGWDQIWASWEEFARLEMKGKVEVRGLRVFVHGDTAYTAGIEEVEVNFPTGPVRWRANVTNIFALRGGAWRMIHHHSDKAPSAEKAIDEMAGLTDKRAMNSYSEGEFRSKLEAALARVRLVLEQNKNPQAPASVPHQYDDKYLLAEFLTRVALASQLQCLENLGLTAEITQRLREWAKTRAVSLRLRAQEDCKFLREETRKVESEQELVTEWKIFGGAKTSRTDKIVTTVTEYFWSFEFSYELVAFPGTAVGEAIKLGGRSGRIEIKTPTKTAPRSSNVVRPNQDVDVTWIFLGVDPEGRASFAIDRQNPTCHTPRQNSQIDAAIWAFERVNAWCARVNSYLFSELFPAQQEHALDMAAINSGEIFAPIVPLFDANGGPSGLLPSALLNAFLDEQRRTFAEKQRSLLKAFPQDGSVITATEAYLAVTMQHMQELARLYEGGVEYIERMLRDQLIAAIGKEVSPADFAGYMGFHYRKLFRPAYRPQPFAHAIRRPDHDPEGSLSIEAAVGSSMADPISTIVASREAGRPMHFALDASTRVAFGGDRHLHAWISHQFSGSGGPSLNLVARARQFSSFLLMVGRIASADTFEPKYAIIVQNKDLLKIPLMLEQIPTPKEFRDAIESLSPEQQRFAKAFRSMQLESTLFGVCVLHIKPQLERLLRLPPDSLTKEIKLTQDLLNLFMEYQIPSDLLSYDGPEEAPARDKLERVRGYAASMQAMIDGTRQREIEEAREREAFRLAEANRTPAPQVYETAAYGPPPGFAPPPLPSPSPGPAPGRGGGGPSPKMAPPPAARPAAAAPAMPVAAPPPPAPAAPPAQIRTETFATTATAAPEANARKPEPGRPPTKAEGQAAAAPGDEGLVDYTRVPGDLDKKFEQLDTDSALRPTIINPGNTWTKQFYRSLLAAQAQKTLGSSEQKEEKNKAFDLVDALSKSGALPFEHASLHVVIAATHCFDQTLLDTVIQQNVNPIEKVERSAMIVATTIHDRPAVEMLNEDQRDRFFSTSPALGPALPPGDRR